MNIVRKRAPKISFTEKPEETEIDTDKPTSEVEPAKKSVGPKTVETVEPKEPEQPEQIKMSVDDTEMFNINTEPMPIPEKKTRKKKQLSDKQREHLARCREKALAKKKALKEIREKEKQQKQEERELKRLEKEEKLKKKREEDELIRQSQTTKKKQSHKEEMFGILDEWYERKQKRKQAKRASTAKPKAQPKAQPQPSKPTFRNQTGSASLCNSKFSPFNTSFQRKTTRRGYMNF